MARGLRRASPASSASRRPRSHAVKAADVRRLNDMGVHQYYVSQILRLSFGAAGASNTHPALEAFRRAYPESTCGRRSRDGHRRRRDGRDPRPGAHRVVRPGARGRPEARARRLRRAPPAARGRSARRPAHAGERPPPELADQQHPGLHRRDRRGARRPRRLVRRMARAPQVPGQGPPGSRSRDRPGRRATRRHVRVPEPPRARRRDLGAAPLPDARHADPARADHAQLHRAADPVVRARLPAGRGAPRDRDDPLAGGTSASP